VQRSTLCLLFRSAAALLVLPSVGVSVACGGIKSAAAPVSDSGAAGEAGADVEAVDSAADAGPGAVSVYPAFKVDVPQILKNAGTVLESPVLVTVTYPGDPYVSTWEAFDDGIGASPYWSATTAEYGVGPTKSGAANHIRMTEDLPASLSYTQLQAYVLSMLTGSPEDAGVPEGGAPSPSWPAPTFDKMGNSQTIYSLYIPVTTAVTDPGSGMSFCVEGGLGYHDNVQLTNGKNIAYAVTLECSSQTLPDLEETAAHETVEAATNPYPESATQVGYIGFDANHLAWDLYTGFADELADACENWQDSYFQLTGSFPYWISSIWSNTAATAGHDPCVPHAAGPYHGMTLLPSQDSTVTVDLTTLGGGKMTTKGFTVSIGKPLTFQLGFFSDAETSAPWTIDYDFENQLEQLFTPTGLPYDNGSATLAIDNRTGKNGDVASVTVTVKTRGGAGFHVMAITWDPPSGNSGYLPHYLPFVLVDE
jgi:hypothetical protein